ncbi:phospholipid-binding lipoprotein MlaA [Colwellia chukchiensis]|uniref:Phospholipid-binding lipoprotein MlaA n=1 Tax=Colwellia chukchiensis TaxID=641665 RepID=A0A1H7HCH5_9GAMM|nr:VacJ family lipoprotein [Colwellia chukchiensis]SEK47964.1 phospholipid-binding lipoprotein MlaA [Colwellia chukchiensis]
MKQNLPMTLNRNVLVQYKLLLTLLFALVISACSSTPSAQQGLSDPKDPFEAINRPFWTFTWDYADKYVLKPASQGYVKYMPTPLRTGVYNMALNLNEPSTIINHLLQAKFSDAAKSTGRFVLNSTIGLLGFFDPADDFGWSRQQEEFGEVLGSYGVGDGPYLMVPALGPSSVREEVGDYVDRYYWPLAIIDFWPNLLRAGIIGMETRAAFADQEAILKDSIDPYEFVKNAYFQNMRYKVYDGNPPIEVDASEEEDIDAYLEELDGLEIE